MYRQFALGSHWLGTLRTLVFICHLDMNDVNLSTVLNKLAKVFLFKEGSASTLFLFLEDLFFIRCSIWYDMIFTKMTEISWLCYKAIIVFLSPFLDWPLCVHWSFLDNFWLLCNCSEWSKAIKTGPPREARNSLEESLRPQSRHGVHLYAFRVISLLKCQDGNWKVPVMSLKANIWCMCPVSVD